MTVLPDIKEVPHVRFFIRLDKIP